jgi:hypothetical protein
VDITCFFLDNVVACLSLAVLAARSLLLLTCSSNVLECLRN